MPTIGEVLDVYQVRRFEDRGVIDIKDLKKLTVREVWLLVIVEHFEKLVQAMIKQRVAFKDCDPSKTNLYKHDLEPLLPEALQQITSSANTKKIMDSLDVAKLHSFALLCKLKKSDIPKGVERIGSKYVDILDRALKILNKPFTQ